MQCLIKNVYIFKINRNYHINLDNFDTSRKLIKNMYKLKCLECLNACSFVTHDEFYFFQFIHNGLQTTCYT